MKAFRILTTVVSLGVILVFSGCGGKGGAAESTQDKQLGLLTKTWKLTSVTLGGVDQNASGAWTNFQLTMTGAKGATSFAYSCTGRPALGPWPASGAWTFGADPVTQIIRDKGTADELPVTYIATTTSLQVNFSYSGNGYTRVSNVSGAWVFIFQ
jgi:hypothetical protein